MTPQTLQHLQHDHAQAESLRQLETIGCPELDAALRVADVLCQS